MESTKYEKITPSILRRPRNSKAEQKAEEQYARNTRRWSSEVTRSTREDVDR
jgi:hypothetical protein